MTARAAKRWLAVEATTVSDAVPGGSGMAGHIKLLGPRTRIAGPAVTVQTSPGDFLSVGRAISRCRQGSVLVVATGADNTAAYAGANMVQLMVNQGLAGLVLDGCIRDLDQITELGFPVFACGTTPRAAAFHREGALNVPILIGGLIVEPGDWVVGDSDGVSVVPRAEAKDVLEQAERLAIDDEIALRRCAAGGTWEELFEDGDAR